MDLWQRVSSHPFFPHVASESHDRLKIKDDIVFKMTQLKMGLSFHEFSLKNERGEYPECVNSRGNDEECPSDCGCARMTLQANEIIARLDELKAEFENYDPYWWGEPTGHAPKYFLKICGGGKPSNDVSQGE